MATRLGTVGAAALMVAAAAGAQSAGSTVLEVFRTELDIEQRVMSLDVGALERTQDQLREATDRLLRLGDDLVRAHKEGEDSASLTARSQDLRRAEAEVAELVATSQQIRTTMAAGMAHIEELEAEVKRLEEAAKRSGDEISGRWLVSIEPGGMKGTFDLKLDGTIASGSYELAGGWKGSFRGTYINGNLRLERVDSQLGFVAVYTGRINWEGGEKRLEGGWESTNLAAGMPASGSWVALREVEK
jgi:hypothetical protein